MSSKRENIDPLKAAHEIGRVTPYIRQIAKAMCVIGMDAGDRLFDIADDIDSLAKECSDGICRESSNRLKDSQQSTANMINAVFAMSELKDGKGDAK